MRESEPQSVIRRRWKWWVGLVVISILWAVLTLKSMAITSITIAIALLPILITIFAFAWAKHKSRQNGQ